MKSPVYLVRTDEHDTAAQIVERVRRLAGGTPLLDAVRPNGSAAVKLHFGEEGNTGFVAPAYVRVICDAVAARGGKPFVSDTNTLYRGRRTNVADHTRLAREHGFSRQALGCEVIIPDDTRPEDVVTVPIGRRFIAEAHVARLFMEAGTLIGIAHFKGHIMTGFGGALKNIGMGCAARKGKLAQHSDLAPLVSEKACTGCGTCVKVCPVEAIALVGGKAVIDDRTCIGCATCIAVCPVSAIEVNWESGGGSIQEKMIEYAYAVLRERKKSSVFFNFAVKITKECDCLAQDDPRIAPDIGILASTDPVALDKASFDLVVAACGCDIFRQVHPRREALKQLTCAAQRGLGSLSYELIEL